MAGSTGYNLNHLQVAAMADSPSFKDINYATKAEFNIDQDSDTFKADGRSVLTAFSAREGSGSIGFGSIDLAMLAILTGETFSTSGTAGTEVDRMELKGGTTPPGVILAGYAPNVDPNSSWKGFRMTVPNAKVSTPSFSFEQESWSEAEADVTFNPDKNDVMLIWENLAATTDTAGGAVIPVALTAAQQ